MSGTDDVGRLEERLDGSDVTLVPVKAFADAKVRLRTALDAEARIELARRLAEGVIRSASYGPVAVVCDDDEVALWASALGASVIWAPGKGLNRAVAFGVSELESRGAARITVVHGDILDPSGLESIPSFSGILLVPDLRDDGTNVISLPSGADFTFTYGPGSFRRHHALAESSEHDVMILRDLRLGHDVDQPSDLPSF